MDIICLLLILLLRWLIEAAGLYIIESLGCALTQENNAFLSVLFSPLNFMTTAMP